MYPMIVTGNISDASHNVEVLLRLYLTSMIINGSGGRSFVS